MTVKGGKVSMQSFDDEAYQRSTPLAIQALKPTRQEMYCVTCRRKVNLLGHYVKLRNGVTAIVAVHMACGRKVYKFVGVLAFEA